MKIAIAAMAMLLATTAATAATPAAAPAAATANPLLAPWTGPYGGVPPFDKAKPELFGPAFEVAIAAQDREIAAIADNPAPPTFENTVVALERAGAELDRVLRLFGVMTNNMSTPAYEALDAEWSPKFAAAQDRIVLNTRLFERIAAVNAKTAGMTPAQARLTQRTYDSFVRQGAKLDAAGKAKLSAYNQELATLFTSFSQKLLADEQSYIVLDSPAQLAGLPEATVAAYRAAATAKGLAGKAIVVNTRSSVDPYLTFAEDRAMREKVWRAFVNRGDNGGPNDTNATIAKIVKLRAERAALLGYPTHAAWRMDDTMAKYPERALALMMKVWPAARARVQAEVADMQAIADKSGAKITIEPWDYRFYAEKVRKDRFDLDQAELKPYFELSKITEGMFWAANRLYGYTFTEITGKVPTFAPGVRVWEVRDPSRNAAEDHLVGLFYADNYARPGKRSGAWMTTYRDQSTYDGKKLVLASNNNNFIPGAPGEPVLISLDDASTLFHEFGHALHFLSVEVPYPSLANTPRDFVEYPSQINEKWLLERAVLDKFARNYQTGAPMPQALVDKIEKSEKFNQGFAVAEYLSSAIVDMELHLAKGGVVDPDAFERATLAKLGMPKELVMRHRLPQFGHLFAGDSYSAGYYSYLWSEVMDADTWAAFEEAGSSWDPVTAAKFKTAILGTGNMTDRSQAYRDFRGRDPDINAYLKTKDFPAAQ